MCKVYAFLDKDREVQWVCRCGNTFDQEGFEESRTDRLVFRVYLAVCLRCGRKFDEDTLDVVGVRLSCELQNDLIPREEFEQILVQARQYFDPLLKA